MDVELLRYILITIAICLGLGVVFVIVLPIVLFMSVFGGAASAAPQSDRGGK